MDGYFEIPIQCNPTYRTRAGAKILLYIDITFLKEQNAADLSHISFDNYYTSSISIALQLTPSPGLVTALESKKLMPRADCEQGSQDFFTVHIGELLTSNDSKVYVPTTNMRVLKLMRLSLYQPCPQWEVFVKATH